MSTQQQAGEAKELPYFSTLLAKKFEDKKERNKSFSLRAYAKFLGISATHLSLVMRGERSISKKSAMLYSEKLALTSEESYDFIQSVVLSKISLVELAGYKSTNNVITIEEKNEIATRYIADPDYHNLCVYFGTAKKSNDVDIISAVMNIDRDKVIQIIKDLFALGFVKLDENDNIKTIHQKFDTNIKVAQSSLKQLINMGFQRAPMHVNKHEAKNMHASFTAMAVDKKKLPELKKLMDEFRHKIAKYSGDSEDSNDIYNLSIGFFPVCDRSKSDE